ncbi:MAG: N-acetyltransferase [Fibrobacterota bacterium]|nr:N-acetyltransferase [Fibrobacterota bacterium]QQS06993.1 MAG: N-acetyltransferase [Fibrobacterota bacterium]
MTRQAFDPSRLILRPLVDADFPQVEWLTREAFWNLYRPGCDEHYLVHLLRGHEDFLPELSFVAEFDGKMIGAILYTRSAVVGEDGSRQETATFGPIAVLPPFQRMGVGGALIQHTKQLAAGMGIGAIVTYGDPHNYCKYGFKNGKDFGIRSKDGDHPLGLLALELGEEVFAGRSWKFLESSVFELDQDAAEAYDLTLEAKEKKWQYSQELFSILIRAKIE